MTRDQIVDISAPAVSYVASIDDTSGENHSNGQTQFLLGGPARLRFLAFQAMSATLKMKLAPGPQASAFPIPFFLTDAQGQSVNGYLSKREI